VVEGTAPHLGYGSVSVEVSLRRGGRTLGVSLLAVLDEWTGQAPYTANLHSGDIGWHLRMSDDALEDAFLLWCVDDRPAAVGLAEGTVLRTALAPDRWGSAELAHGMTGTMSEFEYVDVLAGTAVRHHLLGRGWSADPDPWVLLHKGLGADDASWCDPDTRPLHGASDVAARVAVQRSAFAPGSTFTVEHWHRLVSGPSYDARFELVTWTPSGEPAAAATGWFAGPDRCAILEPVGTHQDHQRKGYGRRVNLAVMAALAAAGASGVRVHTPASNAAAVRAYETCGLRQIDWTTALVRPGSPL
jgi:GNAT superfamily N-acetyltransferase